MPEFSSKPPKSLMRPGEGFSAASIDDLNRWRFAQAIKGTKYEGTDYNPLGGHDRAETIVARMNRTSMPSLPSIGRSLGDLRTLVGQGANTFERTAAGVDLARRGLGSIPDTRRFAGNLGGVSDAAGAAGSFSRLFSGKQDVADYVNSFRDGTRLAGSAASRLPSGAAKQAGSWLNGAGHMITGVAGLVAAPFAVAGLVNSVKDFRLAESNTVTALKLGMQGAATYGTALALGAAANGAMALIPGLATNATIGGFLNGFQLAMFGPWVAVAVVAIMGVTWLVGRAKNQKEKVLDGMAADLITYGPESESNKHRWGDPKYKDSVAVIKQFESKLKSDFNMSLEDLKNKSVTERIKIRSAIAKDLDRPELAVTIRDLRDLAAEMIKAAPPTQRQQVFDEWKNHIQQVQQQLLGPESKTFNKPNSYRDQYNWNQATLLELARETKVNFDPQWSVKKAGEEKKYLDEVNKNLSLKGVL